MEPSEHPGTRSTALDVRAARLHVTAKGSGFRGRWKLLKIYMRPLARPTATAGGAQHHPMAALCPFRAYGAPRIPANSYRLSNPSHRPRVRVVGVAPSVTRLALDRQPLLPRPVCSSTATRPPWGVAPQFIDLYGGSTYTYSNVRSAQKSVGLLCVAVHQR